MHNDVNRERQVLLSYEGGELELMSVDSRAGKFVRHLLIRILKAQLDMFETAVFKGVEFLWIEPDTGGHHIYIKVRFSSGRNECH